MKLNLIQAGDGLSELSASWSRCPASKFETPIEARPAVRLELLERPARSATKSVPGGIGQWMRNRST